MTPLPANGSRLVTLDIVRGVAVMGILAMNIVAFAMIPAAYSNPLAYGVASAADLASWAFSFVFIDGKMRGLFSFLFGASMLLVIQRAEQSGESPRRVTFRRQLWLLLFGLLHYFLIWYGDILVGYALIGMAAWFFREAEPRSLVRWGVGLLFVQLFIMGSLALSLHSLGSAVAAGNPSAEVVGQWTEMTEELAVPSAAALREETALILGPWSGIFARQVTEEATTPLIFTLVFGAETLAYMLFGMAALQFGLLTGSWAAQRYRRIALIGFGISVPAYVALAAIIYADGFSPSGLFTFSFAASVLFRPVMVVGYAALIILLTRRGGWLVDRIAAAGRAAFTNYLGASILMTGLFYGWGLGWFGSMNRTELWVVVVAMWALMLAWSKAWLDRFAYGPFEWLWRSLARWEVQPMRKRSPANAFASQA